MAARAPDRERRAGAEPRPAQSRRPQKRLSGLTAWPADIEHRGRAPGSGLFMVWTPMRPPGASGMPPSNRSRLARRAGAAIVLLVLGASGIHVLLAVHGMFWARRDWPWPQLAGGAPALVLGLGQLPARWPRAHPRLHRWTGRTYITGMLIACVGATGLIVTSASPLGIRAAFAATALAWLTAALAGRTAVRGGRVRAHRRRMVRSHLATRPPVTFRMLIKLPGTMELAPPSVTIPRLLRLGWLLPGPVCQGIYWPVGRTGLRPGASSEPKPLRGATSRSAFAAVPGTGPRT